jgi:hypothetical protein
MCHPETLRGFPLHCEAFCMLWIKGLVRPEFGRALALSSLAKFSLRDRWKSLGERSLQAVSKQ